MRLNKIDQDGKHATGSDPLTNVLTRTPCASTRCRASHNKCDEIRPRCGRCERLSLECETSDFIVPSSWSSSTPGTAVSDEGCSRPTSTWDVFNNSTTPLPNLELPRPQRSHSTTPSIDSEKVNLIQEYQSGVGTWVGLFDDDLNIERTVVKRALECPMLMNAICALTARQISRVGQGEIWESTAVRYYGESLHQLIKMLQDQSYCPEDALAATVLLSSYELLFFPGLDHRRHVSGALSLIRTHACKASSMGVMGAAFWVYARQDVAISLVHERSTMHPPEEWGVSWAQQETAEDRLGNKIIWIVAKVITFTFKTVEEPYAQSLSYDKTSLTNELDAWFESLPASFCGTPFGEPSQEGFIKRVFVVPSTGEIPILIV